MSELVRQWGEIGPLWVKISAEEFPLFDAAVQESYGQGIVALAESNPQQALEALHRRWEIKHQEMRELGVRLAPGEVSATEHDTAVAQMAGRLGRTLEGMMSSERDSILGLGRKPSFGDRLLRKKKVEPEIITTIRTANVLELELASHK